MKNLGLKLFSLFIAVVMWHYVVNNVMIATVSVPVEIQNPPNEKIIVSSFSQQVQVKVSGPAFMVSGIVASPPVFKITVPYDIDNRYVVNLRGDELSFPAAVRVIAIEPSEIEIKFDDKISRSVAVEVPVLGPIDENWRVDAIHPSPEKVVVTGPRKEINGISRVETTPIDLREIKGNQKIEVKLRRPGVLSEVAVEQVAVNVEVSLVESTRRLSGLPVEMRSTWSGQYSVFPDTVSVEVAGSKSAIRNLLKDQVVPYARLASAIDESGRWLDEVAVDVEVPKGVRVVAIEPSVVKLIPLGSQGQPRRSGTSNEPGTGTAGKASGTSGKASGQVVKEGGNKSPGGQMPATKQATGVKGDVAKEKEKK